MLRKAITATVIALGAAIFSAGPVLAGGDSTGGDLPAPGVLGLIAVGVIGAIAFARSRR